MMDALMVAGTLDVGVAMDGAKLKRWRLRRLMSVRDLAERSGVNHSAISQIERGLRQPHPRTIGKLAEALEVDPGELLKGEGDDADD